MGDERCRVTVVGERKRVDLAVPARAPIAEYVAGLADLCGQEDSDVLPAAWTLATSSGRAFPPAVSLAHVGIADGQILYLRDATDGEYDEPAVMDLDEVVAEAADRIGGPRWNVPVRAATTTLIGLLWLVAAPLPPALAAVPGTSLPAAVALATGLLLPLLAWVGWRSRWPIGPVARHLMALAAVPSMAISAWLFLQSAGNDDRAFMGAAVGAVLGALVALVVTPGVSSLTVQLVILIGALTTAAVVRLHATGLQIAATVAVVTYAMIAVAPSAAGHLIAFWSAPGSSMDDPAGEARSGAVRGHRLLAVWNAVSAAALIVALIALAGSSDWYAIALSACLSVAMFQRAGSYLLLVESAPVLLAGAVGAFTLLVQVPTRLSGAPPWFGTTLAGLTGGMVLVVGIALTFRRETEPLPRQAWLRMLATACGVASVPLTLGVYGLLDTLFSIGRQL